MSCSLQSVVLISKLPFVRLFYHILESVAPEFFDGGEASLEAACHDIDSWPSPLPGDLFNLPLLGNILQVWICCTQTCGTFVCVTLLKLTEGLFFFVMVSIFSHHDYDYLDKIHLSKFVSVLPSFQAESLVMYWDSFSF